ncbi:MAG: DUF362 domain-containing protein [Planctomycetota bacterium]
MKVKNKYHGKADITDPETVADMNRRRFLALMTGCGVVGLHLSCNPAKKRREDSGAAQETPDHDPAIQEAASIDTVPVVVKLEHPGRTEADEPLSKGDAIQKVSALLGSLTPGKDAVGFLSTLFEPGRKIGIKLNCLAGRGLSTHPELVFALIELLVRAGISAEDIIVFERTEHELKRAGFPIRTQRGGKQARFMGNDSQGAGFENQPVCFESIGSCFCNILTREIDVLINFGVLKDHDLAGVSIGLKNLYGLIHNPNKYHDQGCAPYVAHVAASPPVREKLKLTICDGLMAQYHGGPALKKVYTWDAGILLASKDPVALDTVGVEIIEKKRHKEGLDTLSESGRYPAWLNDARRSGLGEDRLDRIKVITV